MAIRIGIYGYGNLGKGVEAAVAQTPDMELVGVFTRRDPASLKTQTGAPAFSADAAISMRDDIDVMILCGGSATDLPEQTPALAEHFNVVDSFDTHARIPEHLASVDAAAKRGGKVAVISVGWDPGLFSLARAYASAVLPEGEDYTFWGRGVSQGHSDAIRRIDGVLDARQYTVPIDEALARVRSGEAPSLTAREKHTRECYVVAKEGADLAHIEREIKEMPNYFADYDTTVTFISMEEMKEKHMALPHGGRVIRTGRTGLDKGHSHTIEYSLSLDSNPEFTSSVLVAYARAAYRLYEREDAGSKTVLDVPPALLSPLSHEELIKKLV
ncbi:MAG: diaminopimelate dehydrogenase [Ruminococcaceae bacterium]|nr:diaminopimelate dehydrogenase [Oscillospiraceae bacterium]